MISVLRLVTVVLLGLVVAANGRDHTVASSGGSGTIPPLPGPVSQQSTPPTNHGPVLDPSVDPIILRLVTITQSPHRQVRRIVVRVGGQIVDTGMAPVGAPFVLRIPDGPGVTLDVIGFGSDALGVPVQAGQRMLIVLP